jgi:hypothetical protein
MKTEICEVCGQSYEIGEWVYCPHGFPHGMMTFKPYLDEHNFPEPVEITSWGQRRTLARIHGLVEKEPPSNSKLAERRDRCEWMKEQESHAR